MATPPTASQASAAPKFADLTDLAAEKVGGKILFSTDDWFAPAHNMLKDGEPEWKEGVYTECGKWMDGWETARKRTAGHDWCIIKLGIAGTIEGLEVNTAYFTGNYAPKISIQAAKSISPLRYQWQSVMGNRAGPEDYAAIAELNSEAWETILPPTPLGPGYKDVCKFFFPVTSATAWGYLRVNIFPDGGVARLRVYGQAKVDLTPATRAGTIDLAAVENGGLAVSWSDNHYGHPRNLLNPGRGVGMFDGWETARRKDRPPVLLPGSDDHLQFVGSEWTIVQLGAPGVVARIGVDTAHFKGNYPESCLIEGCSAPRWTTAQVGPRAAAAASMGPWTVLLPRTKLGPHQRHNFEVAAGPAVTHIRITIFPDGGVSRLRIYGTPKIAAKM
eukprot:m.48911 g.48911  ORF g.48911 m.48911 type:complete len:388 (-) comp11430_c2_seq1:66-1229(-)